MEFEILGRLWCWICGIFTIICLAADSFASGVGSMFIYLVVHKDEVKIVTEMVSCVCSLIACLYAVRNMTRDMHCKKSEKK